MEVNVYVTLDKQSMYLVTYSGSVEEGHVPMYDGQNMYWSEAYNAYAWLVISSADEKEVVRTARTVSSSEKGRPPPPSTTPATLISAGASMWTTYISTTTCTTRDTRW